MVINPYLNFNGNCAEAFRFYEKTFGATIEAMMPFEGTPGAGEVPAEQKDWIMHARMTIGGVAVMASDAPKGMYQAPQGFHISVGIEDPAEGERIFAALADGGTVQMPFEKTFWAERFGMVVDRFGTPWMINCEGSANPA
jgi:PhnB protein